MHIKFVYITEENIFIQVTYATQYGTCHLGRPNQNIQSVVLICIDMKNN